MTIQLAVIFLSALLSSAPSVFPAGQKHFELHGRLVDSDHQSIKTSVPSVMIYGANFPFEKQTLINRGGKFRFKNLEAGGYRLRFVVPGWGVMEESIEIGPTFADEDRKIRKEFIFRPDTSIEQHATVSPTRLAVSRKANEEFQKAQKELGKKNTEKAIFHLERAIEESPQFSPALNRLGTIYFHQQEFVKAESYFTRALEAEPDSYPPLVNLCAAQFALRKIQESLECNLEAVAEEPEDPLARSQLGQSYFVLGQFDKSEKELLEAVRLDPSHFSYPQLILGEIYRNRGDDASLIRVLEQFIQLHPDLSFIPQLREVIETKKQALKGSISSPDKNP